MVGLDDLSQAVFRRAVAAVGIGVKQLHQGLVARLDFGACLSPVEVEDGEGAPLEVPERSPLGLGAGGTRRPAFAAAAENPEGIGKSRRPGLVWMNVTIAGARFTPIVQVGRWPVEAERW